MSPGAFDGHSAANNKSVIRQHTLSHRGTIAVWIYGSATQNVMTAKSMEAGWQLQKLRILFGSGWKLEPISALHFQLTWLQSV